MAGPKKLYIPATQRKALLSVTKKRCVHFIAFERPLDASRVAMALNRDGQVFMNGDPILCDLSGGKVRVHETSLDSLSETIRTYGVYMCDYEEPNVVLKSTLLGPGHESPWSTSHQRRVFERAFFLPDDA